MFATVTVFRGKINNSDNNHKQTEKKKLESKQ